MVAMVTRDTIPLSISIAIFDATASPRVLRRFRCARWLPIYLGLGGRRSGRQRYNISIWLEIIIYMVIHSGSRRSTLLPLWPHHLVLWNSIHGIQLALSPSHPLTKVFQSPMALNWSSTSKSAMRPIILVCTHGLCYAIAIQKRWVILHKDLPFWKRWVECETEIDTPINLGHIPEEQGPVLRSLIQTIDRWFMLAEVITVKEQQWSCTWKTNQFKPICIELLLILYEICC